MFKERSFIKPVLLYIFVVILTIINFSKIDLAGINNVIPMMDIMAIFYFTVFKNFFGLFFIFLIGIWNDAISGNLLGLTSLIYVVLIKFFGILNIRILSKENFLKIWLQFIYFLATFLLIKWTFLSLINSATASIWSIIAQLIISAIFYVPIHSFLDYLSAKLLKD